MDINLLRRQMRDKRIALGPTRQTLAATALEKNLRGLHATAGARHIALYLANEGEIDPGRFMHWAFTQAKHCYLPVLNTHSDQAMMFAEITPESRFKPNRFGIPEPVVDEHDLLNAHQLDLILLPLVAFDMQGHRVGMGGGFYDRTLAFTRSQPYDQRPKLIGLAHAFQHHKAIKPSPWDIPLDGIVTDENAVCFHD